MTHAPSPTYRAVESLEAQREDDPRRLLQTVACDVVANHASMTPSSLIQLGHAAARLGAPEAAERTWRRVIEREAAAFAAQASLALGRLLVMSSARTADATAALREAISLDPAGHGMLARAFLGALLVADPSSQAEGRTLLDVAAASGNPEARAWALLGLGSHFAHSHLYDDSADALTEALETKHVAVAPVAGTLLGHVLMRRPLIAPEGLVFQTQLPLPFAFERRADRFSAWLSTPFVMEPGMRFSEAKQALRIAMASDHPQAALNAGVLLSQVLLGEGRKPSVGEATDPLEAVDALRAVLGDPSPTQPLLALMLGRRLLHVADVTYEDLRGYGYGDAEKHLRDAVNYGDKAIKAHAAGYLSLVVSRKAALDQAEDHEVDEGAVIGVVGTLTVPADYLGEESERLARMAIALGEQVEADEGLEFTTLAHAHFNLACLLRYIGRHGEVESLLRASAARGVLTARYELGD